MNDRFDEIMRSGTEAREPLGPGEYQTPAMRVAERESTQDGALRYRVVVKSQRLKDYRFVVDGVAHYAMPCERWPGDDLILIIAEAFRNRYSTLAARYGSPDVEPGAIRCEPSWERKQREEGVR